MNGPLTSYAASLKSHPREEDFVLVNELINMDFFNFSFPFDRIKIGADGRRIYFIFKEKHVLWEKPNIPHVISKYDLYTLSFVNSQV